MKIKSEKKNFKALYAEKLRDPRWQKKRLEIFQRDGFTCLVCGSEKDNLQVHHEHYTGDPWEVPNEHLKTLCFRCHEVTELCKINQIRAEKIIKLCYPGDLFVYLVNHIEGGKSMLSILHNFNGSFEDTGINMSKSFIKNMLKHI